MKVFLRIIGWIVFSFFFLLAATATPHLHCWPFWICAFLSLPIARVKNIYKRWIPIPAQAGALVVLFLAGCILAPHTEQPSGMTPAAESFMQESVSSSQEIFSEPETASPDHSTGDYGTTSVSSPSEPAPAPSSSSDTGASSVATVTIPSAPSEPNEPESFSSSGVQEASQPAPGSSEAPPDSGSATSEKTVVIPAPVVAPTPPQASSSRQEDPFSVPREQAEEGEVWIAEKGTKYHISPDCSNMIAPWPVPLEEAIAMGREPCKKCY